jgi:two-component system, LytTR family, response regulator
MIRTLIVDDEPFARQRIRRLLSLESNVEIVGEAGSGREAIASIGSLTPDLVFLDIQMPQVDGFAVARALPSEHPPVIVFVTAFDEHALRAFDVHALDYILKPVDPDRFRAAMDRVRAQLADADAAGYFARIKALLAQHMAEGGVSSSGVAVASEPSQMPPPSGEPQPASLGRFLVREEGRMYFVKIADVDWIEAWGNYARLHAAGKRHLIRETMSNLERQLDAAGFVRIHRSTIVNLERVRELQPSASGEYVVLLSDGTRLKLSRWFRERLERRLER